MKSNSLLAACLAWLIGGQAQAADWPAYRHDVRRSAETDETLPCPLRLAWEYRCAQAPRPAQRPAPAAQAAPAPAQPAAPAGQENLAAIQTPWVKLCDNVPVDERTPPTTKKLCMVVQETRAG